MTTLLTPNTVQSGLAMVNHVLERMRCVGVMDLESSTFVSMQGDAQNYRRKSLAPSRQPKEISSFSERTSY